jgi:hypothetical protein
MTTSDWLVANLVSVLLVLAPPIAYAAYLLGRGRPLDPLEG